MAWEQREGSGSLFLNDKKGNERAPNYRGDILLDGVVYELAGWVKTTQKGDKFLSLAGKPKEEKKEAPKSIGSIAEMESDPLPF